MEEWEGTTLSRPEKVSSKGNNKKRRVVVHITIKIGHDL